MSDIRKNIMDDTCRTCLSYFNDNNEKSSLLSCFDVTDSARFELLKNIMTACSLTLFTKNGSEIANYVCACCVAEMDKMLNFIEKCIRTETILKEIAEVKIEANTTCSEGSQEGNESGFLPKITVKIEENRKEDLDDVPLTSSAEFFAIGNTNGESEECHETFPSALSFYEHTGCKLHTCGICNENFRTVQLIKKHMEAEHDGFRYQPYFCRQCPDVFSTRHHLTRHEQRRHNAKVYSCNACKRTFSTISSLKFHQNTHLGAHSHSCAVCSKSFTSASVLRDHKRIVHSEMKKFDCHCGRSFNRKKKLEFHIDSVHEKKDKLRKYSCPECDKKFHHPYALKNHLNTHLGIKPFLCNACGSAFTALSNLTSHFRRIHSGEKQPALKMFLCHNCGESFARASHLKRHNLRKHVPNAEKKHECPICKKRFLEKSDVTGHVKLHDDLKPFVCDQCTKCFRTSWRLQAHINRVHLGLRPFECPTCSVKFKTKSHLEKHIRTHTGEKPFPCPHCAYTCAEKSNLKKHINIHLKAM